MTKSIAKIAGDARKNPERRARIDEYKCAIYTAIALAELRNERGLTQREVANTLRVSQANVSRIEHEEDLYLSTLRNYIAALGGKLEVNAVFSDCTVSLLETGG